MVTSQLYVLPSSRRYIAHKNRVFFSRWWDINLYWTRLTWPERDIGKFVYHAVEFQWLVNVYFCLWNCH